MAEKDPEKVRENLERGRENLEQSINSTFLTDPPTTQPSDQVEEMPVVEPDVTVPSQQTGVFARPSAADRIEGITSRVPSGTMPSLADRAERQVAIQRARQQSVVQPSLADRAERNINVRLQQLLDPQERVKYSPAAVAQLNAELEAARKQKTQEQEAPAQEREPLAGGMFAVDTGLNDFVNEQRAQQTVTQPPVESLKGQTERSSFVLENYPTLMAAANRAGLSDDEVRDLVNFTLAFDAANLVGSSINPERRAAILATMSKPMQALVVDIINAGIQEDRDRGGSPENYAARVSEAQQSGRDVVSDAMGGASTPLSGAFEYVGGAVSKAIEQQQIIGEQSTGNTGQDVLRTFWNWSLGPAFDAWFAGAENIQRGVRAGSLVAGTELGDYSWSEAWNAASKNQFSDERLDELREMYGQKPVDLVVETMQAKTGDDPDFIGTLIQKYQDDPEMLDYLDKAINGVRNDKEFADLISSVRAAQTGDLGNVAAQTKMELLFPGSGVDITSDKPVGEYEQTASYWIQRNLVNVLGVFFLDPLLAFGVVRSGALAARYGMARVALEANAPVKGTKVFREPNVQNFLRTMGGQLQDLNRLEATEGVAAMAPANASIRSMYKRFFTPEALDDMRIFMRSHSKPDSDPAALLEEYFGNVENIQHIIVGQSARRMRQIRVPHMTEATARAKLASLKLRGLTYPSVGSAQFLDNVFFEGFSASLPEQAGEDLARIISAENGDKYVGRALGDFLIRDGEMVRTLTGRLVLDRLPKSWKVGQRYGWKRETGAKAFAERMRRLGAIWPDASRPLKVSDGSDAARVEKLVLAAGMPRHFSQILREIWVASDEATRRMIGEGLARSYGYARGVDVVSDEGKRLIDEIGPGAGRGDQYAASMPNMVELEGQAMRLAQQRIDEIKPVELTDEGREALTYYTTTGYGEINTYLRDFDDIQARRIRTRELFGDEAPADIPDWQESTIRALDEATQASVATSDTVLYRGTGLPDEQIPIAGQTVSFPEYLSTTSDEGLSVRWTEGGGTVFPDDPSKYMGESLRLLDEANFFEEGLNKTYWTIEVPKGSRFADMEALGIRADQKEFLLPRNSSLKIIKVEDIVDPETGERIGYQVFAELQQSGTRNVKELANDILRTELAPSAAKYNPSMVNGRPGAITLSDMTEYMAFPDINKLESVTARSSLLTALTGQNAGMSNATDFWVLGTLAGPRFQVRNAIEDMGLYVATAGSLRGYLKGRRFSTGRREATERPRETEFAEPQRMKLGMFKTLSRALGGQIGKLYADETAAIILPNLSRQDLIKANNLAREGNREALAKLVAKAYIRQRLRFLPGGRRVIGRTVDETKLTSEQLQELRWLEQAVEHGDVLRAMDEAAETSRHLADGFPARPDDMEDPGGLNLARNGDVVRVAGQDMKVHEYTVSYEDIPVYNGSNQSIKQWHHNIAKILHGDGPKGQWTMQLLPRYYRAVRAGNQSEVEEIVKELAERVAGADEAWGYGTRSMIQRASGFDGLARASLDNALQLFTTQNGRFNRPLFRQTQRKVVREDGTEFTEYALWSLDEAGERVSLVSQSDLAELAIKNVSPMYVNAPVTVKVTTPVRGRGQWSNRAWAAMGRSLARMTREPIFTANYLDSRSALAPFEKKLVDVLGEEGAEKWAVNAATERAFRLTMNYVDNPNVRSQFAWQIRNVARFYRALEDFNRRMIRTARNEPMAFAKIALAWNALDDSGFVWDDEFGEKYFVWPGSRQAFEAINGVFNMFGPGNVFSPSLPLAFTSRVNMVTPSADPNSWLPTFSGPYAAMAVLPIMRQLPGLRNLEEEFFGEYGKNRTVWDQTLPSHVNRVLGFLSSQRGTTESRLNETDTVFASAARSAALAYAAAGLWEPDKFYSAEEIEEHRRRLDVTAQWIVGLKMVLSPVAFAALSVNVDTATDFAKTLGLDGMRPTFVQLLRKNDGDVSAASIQWLKMNPDLSPFMIGTTESPDDKGYYGPFEETVRWVEDNEDVVKISSSGASYFAPTDGRQTLAAWNFLSASGLKSRKSTDTYMKEIMNAEGKAIYYSLRSQWIDQKRAGVKDADGRWEAAKQELFAVYPRLKTSLAGGLATGTQSTIDEMVSEVDSMREVGQVLKDSDRLDERGETIYNLIGLRDQLDSRLNKIDPNSPNEFKEKEKLRDTWKNVIEDHLSLYPDDRQFRNVLYVLSESLVENWGRYV